MERSNTNCVHCTHIFDIHNLKNEYRRSIGKQHSNVDLINVLPTCYELEEVTLRNHVVDDEYFVCVKCFNKLKGIFACQSKCKQLIDSLKESTSSSFMNFTNDCVKFVQSAPDTYACTDSETESHETSVFSTTKKRCRNSLTPSRSGCTPRAKRTARTPKAKNRRRLHFSQTPQQVGTQSPGPKVKVHVKFKGSCRKTDLKGHEKMACKAIVQKQYKTALNHLLEIEDAKKELSNTVKKRLNQEVQKLCSAKDSVFRSTNITKFSWKSAYEEFAKNCPLTHDIFSIISGNKEKQTPRLVSSMGVLLFTRNQKMNTLQAINSVLMFRGHVRSRVYSTFNRAGLCSSYKSTLNTIDRLCESFDIPVKNWAKKVSSQSQTTCSTNKETSSGDHCYAGAEDLEDYFGITHDHSYLSPDVRIYTAEVIQDETPQLDSIPQTPLNSKDRDGLDLGILEKDENITEQMIDIIAHLQQHVPKTDADKMIPILLGGNALSVERGEAAERARIDAITPEDRLHGFLWKSEDWHGHVISLQETFNLLYKGTSSGEKGTLFQLRNAFDRRGVKSEVTNAVNDCREFLRFATKGYIVLAAFQILGVKSPEEFETAIRTKKKTIEEKEEFLTQLSSDIVTQFVETKQFHLQQGQAEKPKNKRIACGYPDCQKTYLLDGRCRQRHRTICPYRNYTILAANTDDFDEPVMPEDTTIIENDYRFNYTCCVLREGLMDWCREDAAKENDGDRLVRMWRFDLLRFSLTNHTKYRILAFKLQAQLMALLPPKLAHELQYNRCVNVHGGKRGNVPGNLALEFMNMRAKDALNALHGNLTSASIQRCGRSLQRCNNLIDSYTKGLDQFFGKPSNSKPSIQKDVQMMIEQLKNENLFAQIPGRHHRSFPTCETDPLCKLNGDKLNTWLCEKKEQYAKKQRTRSYNI